MEDGRLFQIRRDSFNEEMTSDINATTTFNKILNGLPLVGAAYFRACVFLRRASSLELFTCRSTSNSRDCSLQEKTENALF